MLAALAVVGGACQSPVALPFETASSLPKQKGRPAGIAVDLVSATEPASAEGMSEGQSLTLRAPYDETSALITVEAFLQTMVNDRGTALAQLLVPSARYHDIKKPMRVRHLRYALRQRLRRFAYEELRGQVLFDKRNIGVYRGKHVARLPAVYRPSQRALASYKLAADGGASWLVFRVPMLHTSIAKERVFGNELVFWLVPTKGKYRVLALYEDAPI